jgi:FkbM family methyltransferase
LAEESRDYNKYAWGYVVWVEAQGEKVSAIRNQLDPDRNHVIQAVAWSESGKKMDFNFASNGESSSLLDFGTHKTSYPAITFTKKVEIVTIRLDEVLPTEFGGNFLNLDIQGAELEALIGLGAEIARFDWIYTEVNKKEVYINCATVQSLDHYLSTHGFRRVSTRWILSAGWGDALYTKVGIEGPNLCQKIILNMYEGVFYLRQILHRTKNVIMRP